MSKWADEHKIMIEKGQWYVTVDDVESLIEEFNREIEIVRSRLVKENSDLQRKYTTYREMVRQGKKSERK